MAAVVHHGGAGTTAAGLRAGIPSVIIPFFAEQPFWGQRVAELGVGPKPIPRKRLSEERLAAAIHTAVSDEGMRRHARALGERIRAEDGVARAVEVFHRCCTSQQEARRRTHFLRDAPPPPLLLCLPLEAPLPACFFSALA